MFVPFFRHWKVGVGVPVAVTEKLTGWPIQAARSVGCAVMAGLALTVRFAVCEVVGPQGLPTTQV